MHPDYKRAHEWTRRCIGAAIEVHRILGPGLMESIYEKSLAIEFDLQGIPAVFQKAVPLSYKGYDFDDSLRLDVFVDECLILELKAVEEVLPVHKAQLLSYMHMLKAPLGLVINFKEARLVDGVYRNILPGADQ